MKSQWSDKAANEAIAQWGDAVGPDVALRLYAARLIGADDTLVLHGGGNVSVKRVHRTALGEEVPAVFVKASGVDLVSLEPRDLPALDLAYLLRFRGIDSLDDDTMVNELRRALFDASAPTPSVETLVHAFLRHTFVDHSHADAVLAVTNHPNGEQLVREALGDRVAVLPYVRPGFELAQAVADCYEANHDAEGIVLLHHGLITFGDDARTAYERHIELVDRCEQFLATRMTRASVSSSSRGSSAPAMAVGEKIRTATVRERPETDASCAVPGGSTSAGDLVARMAPLLRGLLAGKTGRDDQPFDRPILEWRGRDELLSVLARDDAETLAMSGPLTGDHILRTGATPLFVADLDTSDDDKMRDRLTRAIETYRRQCEAFLQPCDSSAERRDDYPRVVMVRGAGVLCWGSTKRDAGIAADIAERTLETKVNAEPLGPYQPLPSEHWADMLSRNQQRAKLAPRDRRPLAGQVVAISGGAGAIGAAVAEVCAEAGAHVAVADLDESRAKDTASRVEEGFGRGVAMGLGMDVTDEASVRDGFALIVRTYGGVDVVVPNAGVAHVAGVADMDVSDFRRVMDINATGYLLFMREGVRIMKRQGLGGHVIINASKNVFGPGAQFGAYSASKAAGHQLGKVAAIELAEFGIRVNMINADAIFGEGDRRSGLWETVGPSRAKRRGLTEADLPDYYKKRSLLKTRVCGRHVGNAVVFFASNATPTTGATLPVDGGVVDAFPR